MKKKERLKKANLLLTEAYEILKNRNVSWCFYDMYHNPNPEAECCGQCINYLVENIKTWLDWEEEYEKS